MRNDGSDPERDFLEEIADLHGVPEGAYNIRANGKLAEPQYDSEYRYRDQDRTSRALTSSSSRER